MHRIRIYREESARARAVEHVFGELLKLELDLAEDEAGNREAQSMSGGREGGGLSAEAGKLGMGEDPSDHRRKLVGGLAVSRGRQEEKQR